MCPALSSAYAPTSSTASSGCRSASRPGRSGPRPEVTAQVTDQLGHDQAIGEAPGAGDALERVVIAPADDGLEREARPRLEDGERGARARPIRRLDLHDEVGDHVASPGDAVVEQDAVVRPARLGGTAERLGADRRSPGGVLEQRGHAVEIAGVDALGIRHDQRGDGLDVRRHGAGWCAAGGLDCKQRRLPSSLPVRIGVALPNYGPLAGPDVLVRLAQLAEGLGADGVWLSDHLVAPVNARSVYPHGTPAAPGPTRLGIIEEFYE